MPRNPPGFKRPPRPAPPPKKRKPPPSPEDVHTGRHAPPDRRPPKPAPSPEDVHTGRHAPPDRRPPDWILKRQRALRAAGYAIRVDGQWGPRSQTAWNAYQRGQRMPSVPAVKPPPRPRFNLGRLTPVPEITQGLPHHAIAASKTFRAARILDTPDGRASGGTLPVERRDAAVRLQNVAVQQEIRKARRVARYARLKSPEKMTLSDLVAITIDPVTHQFSPMHAADTKRVQRWLKVHGHPKIKVDGVWGRTTFKALASSYFAAQRDEQHKRVVHVGTQLYGSKIIKPGQNIPGLGTIKGPAELTHALMSDSFGAAIAWRWMNEQARDHPNAFLAWRDKQMLTLEWQATLRRGGTLAVNPLMTNNLDRYLRLAASLPGGSREIGALSDSKTLGELNRRLLAIRRYDAARRRHEMAASEHHPWWQGALSSITKPGDWTRHELNKFGAVAYDVYDRARDPYASHSRNTWQDRYPDIEQQAGTFEEWFAKNHSVMNFGYQMTVDPLNYVFPLAGMAAVGATRGGIFLALRLEDLGYGVTRLGELSRFRHLAPLTKSGLALTAPARGGRLLTTSAHVELQALKNSRLGYAATKATRLKTEAVASARGAVLKQMRHGFNKKPIPGEDDFLGNPETVKGIASFDQRVDPMLDTRFKTLLPALVKKRMSLYSHANRGELSGVGASILARAAEVFRVNEVKRLALSRAREAYWNVTEDGVVNKVAAEAAARRAYRDILQRSGSYIRGAHDPEIARLIQPAVYRHLDNFEYVVLRNLQNRLERVADDAGRSLWDDEGRWIGRASDERDLFRAFGSEAYDPARARPVLNPSFGKLFTAAEKDEIVQGEIRGEVGRLQAWAAREAGEGRAFSEDALDNQIAEIHRRAEKGWTRDAETGLHTVSESGKYKLVPDITIRQLRHTYGDILDGKHPLMGVDDIADEDMALLKQLSESPEDAFGGTVDAELEAFGFIMAGGPTKSQSAGAFATRLDPNIFTYQPQMANKAIEREYAEWRDVINGSAELLGRGFNEALPKALRKEWALYAALSESQGVVGRYSYRAIKGGVDLWIFLTLPMRPGWGVRNIIDNTAKVLTRGAHDPRIYWGAGIGKGGTSVFDLDLRAVWHIAAKFDQRFGTHVADDYQKLINTVWQHRTEALQKIFQLHDIHVPAGVLEDARFNPFEHGKRVARPSFAEKPLTEKQLAKQEARTMARQQLAQTRELGMEPTKALVKAASVSDDVGIIERFKDGVWELMATKPESAAKRVLYRKKYQEAIDAGLSERVAFEQAWGEVEHTLFDYGKVSVIEDNLKPIMPFVQFWRKNTVFWLKTAYEKPWLPYGVYKAEQELKDTIHSDLPEWMRRYIHTDEIADGINQVPGLAWLAGPLADADSMIDPLSFFSFAPLYRTFKNENPTLPADKQGWAFIAPMIDAMNDWGLSMNPLLRKPLEGLGVANYRAWQSILPQTSLVQAFTRKWMSDWFGSQGLNIENMVLDPALGHLLGVNGSEQIAKSFNQYVQMEMANQALRGETPNRAKAEKTIRSYFLVNQVVAYFGGVYARRSTPQDIQLWKMSDDFHKGTKEWDDLTKTEQEAYQLYKRRKLDPVEFDRYVSQIPLIQAYFGQGSYKQKEIYKQQHPEIIPFVEPAWSGKGLQREDYLHHAQLVQNTDLVMRMSELASELKLSPEVRDFATNLLVTEELRAFWAQNDTPADIREKQLRGQWHKYINRLTDTYFAIPEGDYDAKSGFLKQHPVLEHWWLQNNTNSDDLKAFINASNADLREAYFERLDAKDYNGAQDFLHAYPFIFEFTRAADKVDPDTGDWIGGGKGGGKRGGKGLSQHAQDYLAARSSLNAYFAIPESQRSAWLASGSSAAKIVKSYFAKYSHFHGGRGRGSTQHSRDYLAVAPLLKRFFRTAKNRGFDAAWDSLGPKEEARVKAYFRKYAHPHGHSQHAKAWMENKKYLDIYFKMDKAKRNAWLHGGSKEAERVLAYFKRWGKVHQSERAWRNLPLAKSLRPELAMRLKFWKKYWSLSPDARPEFVLEHAADYGVFIYGPLGQKKRDERVNDYLRQANAKGIGDKAAMYLYIKPLMDYFFTLKTRQQKQLFLKANPELDYYFKVFAKPSSPTGNKKLDAMVEHYFALPEHSQARTDYLKKNHEVQVYFDKRSTPAERAMHNMLEVYFGLFGRERKEYGLQHPEIQVYFDKRSAERDAEKMQLETFAQADPRLRKFWDIARVDIGLAGDMVRESLFRQRHLGQGGIQTRRERTY